MNRFHVLVLLLLIHCEFTAYYCFIQLFSYIAASMSINLLHVHVVLVASTAESGCATLHQKIQTTRHYPKSDLVASTGAKVDDLLTTETH